MKAIVYSKNACGYCTMAKNLLKMKGVEIEEYNIQEDNDARARLFEECSKENVVPRTAPQIWLDEKYIGGFEELKRHFDNA